MSTLLDAGVETAATLARRWAAATDPGSAADSARLAALVASPAGLDLAVRFIDRVVRPDDARVAARELARLRSRAAAARDVVGPLDAALLAAGARLAPVAPALVVPAARSRLHDLVGHLVADDGPALGAQIARTRRAGFQVNLNLLGEAVLGEAEARSRLMRLQALAARPDVDHVSVKVSSIVPQLSPWDLPGEAARVRRRLGLLLRSAARSGTAVTVDMEEYRDLRLTLAAFTDLMADPALHGAALGIALQAYLPESLAALQTVTEHARSRVAAGGRPVAVRLVKGANLPMEAVDAELRGHLPAPYPSKAEVDASFVQLLDHALRPENAAVVHVGVASHNLFHLALAHVLATDRGSAAHMRVEMLLGMAPAQARAVRNDVGRVLLYTPVAAREDADVAIAYLVRRLEEVAAEQNFLHGVLAGGPPALDAHEEAFRRSVRDAGTVSRSPRRVLRPAEPAPAAGEFHGTPDTDPAAADAPTWAAQALRRRPRTPARNALRTVDAVDAAVARARELAGAWAAVPPADRAAVLRTAAAHLAERRAELVGIMAQEAGKTVGEADPEVSEAVDFARYYALAAEELTDGHVPGARFRPHGVTVVAPPWNFPVAIPMGSTLAALAAGSPVLLKPAPQVPRSATLAGQCVRRALEVHGIPPDVLQVVETPEDERGRRLVSHPDVARVVLTGSLETAELFARWREDLEVVAETSGKNAVVVTPAADVDLAVADVVRSAFGHAGQKCSAASLLILVGSAATSPRLHRQLADAVGSLRVGPATHPGTAMGPLVEPPSGKLLRALTTLDPGEAWLVRPRELGTDGRLWSPGVKHGVRPGSFFHTTECFGPVLGVMRAATLDEAIELQNAVAFGLTGGLHSLDEDEIATWLDRVEVGNAYVNRHITGAIVRRQAFGGWKASTVGPGAKAGGPNYVAQLGRWVDGPDVPTDDAGWLAWAQADDRRWWRAEFGVDHDVSGMRAESDVFRYRPVPGLTVRCGLDAPGREVRRVLAAARLAAVPATVSRAGDVDDDAFATAVRTGSVTGRIRAVGHCPGLRDAARTHPGDVTLLDGPVLASGRRELLTVLREQSVSRTRHRFGRVTELT